MVKEQCRTCLKTTADVISFSSHHVVCNKVMLVVDLLKSCSSVQLDVNDGYPQQICLPCARQAEVAYQFRLKCEEADKTLRNADFLEQNGSAVVGHSLEALEEESSHEDDYSGDKSRAGIKDEAVMVAEELLRCEVCNLIFPTAAGLARHSSAHQKVFHKCSRCRARFISEALLKKHMSLRHSTYAQESNASRRREKRKKFNCEICCKKFVSHTNLQVHLKRHATEENIEYLEIDEYQCKLCPEKFDSLAGYDTHLKAHDCETDEIEQDVTETSNYSCIYCEEVFDNTADLHCHLQQHADKRKNKNDSEKKILYKCRICFEEVPTLANVKEHLESHDIPGDLSLQHLLYKCSECQVECASIHDYYGHATVHKNCSIESSEDGQSRGSRKRPYKCTVSGCEKTFPTPSSLRSHSRSHQSPWPKKCRHCDAVMQKWHDYMTHLNEQHDEMRTFICSQCGKKFFKERNLERHAKTHSGERNYMCDICGFSFHAQNNLVAHRRLHTGVKPYKCTYCPKAFSQYAGLRSHLINHVGERQHECSTCHRKFLRLGSLKNHIKTHTGAKDYACHICGARFGASSTRKKHLLIHTGERNHICDFCGKAFGRRSNLNVHRKIHTGETSHVCEICGKGFIQAHVLRTHMNTHRKRTALENSRAAETVRLKPQSDDQLITELPE